MARTLAERWRQSPIQQTAEAVFGHAIAIGGLPLIFFVLPIAYGWHPALAGALSAIPTIITREIVDSWPIESVGDMLFDSAEIMAGRAITGALCAVWL